MSPFDTALQETIADLTGEASDLLAVVQEDKAVVVDQLTRIARHKVVMLTLTDDTERRLLEQECRVCINVIEGLVAKHALKGVSVARRFLDQLFARAAKLVIMSF